MLSSGTLLELTVEKAAGGGRMIARHEGQVVLVSGAVPGERVEARVERADRKVAFAAVTDVREPSPDRREAFPDPLCGGCVYSHIHYPRQLELKADVVRDAFLRIGRIPLTLTIPVMPSPERGHRMRARLHVRGGRAGFFREGTHELCDPAPTGQLTGGALQAIDTAVQSFEAAGVRPVSVELTENMPGDARVLAIEVEGASRMRRGTLSKIVDGVAIAGLTATDGQGNREAVGETAVADALAQLTHGRATQGELRRRPESFFQANRFLVPDLVTSVLDVVGPDGRVLDLYAGVGLFAVSLAASGRRGITAVEGDRSSGADLQRNAGAFGDAIVVALESVEAALRRRHDPVATVIVDPPRTGLSADALAGIVRLRARQIVYVSCDPATLSRDARRLLDAGYSLESLRAFDLFPNTAHVESLGVFVLPGA
jgi:23S rRNA (uracil1939-C5)-methyltransferase